MTVLLDYTIYEAVAADGLSRVADYDDGSRHVLFLGAAGKVQSLATADWIATRGPLPHDPTPEESQAAIAQRETARQQASTDAAALRQQILTLAQSAVGVRLIDLTAGQRNALIAILLWKEGAIDAALVVRPLSVWVKD